MTRSINRNSDVLPVKTHRCGWGCLGPLTFHNSAMGERIHLSQGCHLAERKGETFKNGLVFSSRTVKPMEKIRLRVEEDVVNWHGALRVGFTNVSPSSRPLPLPSMAMPDLTNTPGHWAAVVHESLCIEGSELEFWFSSQGKIYVSGRNCSKHKLVEGVDLSKPLWAMIDVYGKTRSIFLLGSKKGSWSGTKTSCPAPERITPSNDCKFYSSDSDIKENISLLKTENQTDCCVVCWGHQARVTLPCGHRCLCIHCAPRVIHELGSCPLCRCPIKGSSEGRMV